MMVVNPSAMQVTAGINQVDISEAYIGQPAEIRLDAYPTMVFPGRVERITAIGIARNSKRIRFFSAIISIQGSDPRLLPGLTAAADLQLDTAKDVLMLPREAVAIRDGQAMVEVLENGKPKLQPIKTGLMDDCEVVIESGLKEGTTVSLNPQIPADLHKPAPGQI